MGRSALCHYCFRSVVFCLVVVFASIRMHTGSLHIVVPMLIVACEVARISPEASEAPAPRALVHLTKRPVSATPSGRKIFLADSNIAATNWEYRYGYGYGYGKYCHNHEFVCCYLQTMSPAPCCHAFKPVLPAPTWRESHVEACAEENNV